VKALSPLFFLHEPKSVNRVSVSIIRLSVFERETSPAVCSLPQRGHGGRRSIYKSKEEAAAAKPWMACKACPAGESLKRKTDERKYWIRSKSICFIRKVFTRIFHPKTL